MADVKHAVMRTDKMAGTTSDVHLYHVMYKVGDVGAEIENGNIVQIGALNETRREVFDAAAPVAGVQLDDLAIVCAPVLFYDESRRHYEDEWVNEADRPVRAYGYHPGDIFSVTAEAFNGTPAKDKFVDYEAGVTTLKVADAASETTIGKIIQVETIGRYTYYVVREIAPTVAG